MRRERVDSERLSDNAILLYLWARAQDGSSCEGIGDRLKLMKLAFLVAYPLFRDKVKALNLRFFRHTWGPYSVEVDNTWEDLKNCGLLSEEEVFAVTDDGQKLSSAFAAEVLVLPENAGILQALDSVIGENAALDTPALLKKVYDMRCYTLGSRTTRQKVSAVPRGTEFTAILEEDQADHILVVPPGWQITLELAFHADGLRNLQRGIEDSHEGRVYGWEALGADV
jgi:uncharacterized protein YwgA